VCVRDATLPGEGRLDVYPIDPAKPPTVCCDRGNTGRRPIVWVRGGAAGGLNIPEAVYSLDYTRLFPPS
jgi:hypothetical protein